MESEIPSLDYFVLLVGVARTVHSSVLFMLRSFLFFIPVHTTSSSLAFLTDTLFPKKAKQIAAASELGVKRC